MDFNAVFHRSTDNYCYMADEERLIINIETGTDVTCVNIIMGDPFANGILGGGEGWDGEPENIPYHKRLKNKLWWTTTVIPEYKRLKYYFEIMTDTEKWYYFEDGFLSEEQFRLEGRSHQCFVMPWMNPADVNHTPKWVNDTVWYQIFPERFCNGNTSNDPEGTLPWKEEGAVTNKEFYGGDFKGITDRIPYLAYLGITGIYLTPVNLSPTCHKYDTTDYELLDPSFGTEEEFIELVNTAHRAGIKVMLDGVFNHSGYNFTPWQDVLKKGPDSEYYDWFMINRWPLSDTGSKAKQGDYYTFAFFDGMPKLNTNNPKVQDYFIGVCERWVKKYNIDGIRLDVANEVSHVFCKKLRAKMKAIDEKIYILGEIWYDSIAWLRGDEFDAVMNYPLAESMKDFWLEKKSTNDDFEMTVNRLFTRYMNQTNDVMFNMLDSHDTKRLRSQVRNEGEFYQLLAVLFAMPGSPCIYYGTEIMMEGDHDPDCRRCMPWTKIDNGEFDDRIYIIKSLIELRKKEDLLKSRNFHFPHTYSNPRLIQFLKCGWGNDALEVLVNCSDEDVELKEGGEILFKMNLEEFSGDGNTVQTLKPYGILFRRNERLIDVEVDYVM